MVRIPLDAAVRTQYCRRMPTPRPLTDRQAEIYSYIRARHDRGEIPPTRREIAEHFGFYENAAEDHLKALQRKGRIKLIVGLKRGIQIRK